MRRTFADAELSVARPFLLLQRLKLQEAQSQLQSLKQAYSSEKAENAQLKAKIKDGMFNYNTCAV